MNKNQKILLIVVAIVWAAMLLCPPFVIFGENGVMVGRGYKFIFLPGPSESVHVAQLFLQMLVIAAIGGVGWLVLKGGKGDK